MAIPLPGSLFDSELSVARRRESLVTARSIAMTLIESGGEHITAFVKMITKPIEPIACLTCIRSMLEPCARAAWLLDPAIDGDMRIRRTLAIRFDEMAQGLRFARALHQPKEARGIENRIRSVERDAQAIGYRKLRDRNGKRIGIGVRMPGVTELVKKILGEEEAYRILSAVSHGQAGTIRNLTYTPVPQTGRRVKIGGVPTVLFEKIIDPGRLAWLGWIGARAFAMPVWYEFTYAGWDKDPLRELFEAAFDLLESNLLEVGPTERFWR